MVPSFVKAASPIREQILFSSGLSYTEHYRLNVRAARSAELGSSPLLGTK